MKNNTCITYCLLDLLVFAGLSATIFTSFQKTWKDCFSHPWHLVKTSDVTSTVTGLISHHSRCQILNSLLWIGPLLVFYQVQNTHLLGTLAMTSWFLMMKKICLAILHQTSFFTSLNLQKSFMVLQGFVISDIVFWCDHPTDNPSPLTVCQLILLTDFVNEFSGITTLQSVVSEN